MTGSLQIKKDKFYMVLNTVDTNGKRKAKWISTGLGVKGNKKRAEKMLRDTLAEQERTMPTPKSEILFSDWIRQWLTESAKRVDEVTHRNYEDSAKSHVLPYFEELGVSLHGVTRPMLQTFIDLKRTKGRKDGKGGLSIVCLRHFRNILNQSLKLAVQNELIPSNPCEGLLLPKQERREFSYYSAEQLNSLLNAIKDEPLYPLVYIGAYYGLRRSELLGLQWDSIDWGANTLTVKHTVVQYQVVIRKDKTKNASSRRTMPLLPEVRQMLLDLKACEDENRRLFGNTYDDNPYIFKWVNGKPYEPDYTSKKFKTLLRKYGFPHIRFHELRHSCASLLINQGFNLKDVQEWLGHADIQMTANVYGHLDIARKQTIANSISSAISAAR